MILLYYNINRKKDMFLKILFQINNSLFVKLHIMYLAKKECCNDDIYTNFHEIVIALLHALPTDND